MDRIKAWLQALPSLDDAFEALDANKDGALTREELLAASCSGLCELDADTCRALMTVADADGDGRVSLSEFKQLGLVLRHVEGLRAQQDRVVAGEKAWTANKKYLDGTRLRASPEYGDFNGMSILNDVKVAVIEVEPTGEYALVQQEAVGSAPNPDWVQAIGWIRAHNLTKTQRNHGLAQTLLECCVCFGDFTAREGVRCTGEDPHFQCDDCLVEMVTSSCTLSAGGGVGTEFFTVTSNRAGVTCERGQIPCPYFSSGCSCASLANSAFIPVLAKRPEVMQQYVDCCKELGAMEARERAEELRKLRAQEAEQRKAAEALSGHSKLLADVEDLVAKVTGDSGPLMHGATVPCPFCGFGGGKSDACMQMDSCPCGGSWCFCCGKPSTECRRGAGGCDAISCYLQHNPGWEDFALRGESAGGGALREFYRRRCAFFLRELKEETDINIWEQMELEHEHLLDNIVPGRSVSWREIDGAEYPIFGDNTSIVVTKKQAELEENRARRRLEVKARRHRDRAKRQEEQLNNFMQRIVLLQETWATWTWTYTRGSIQRVYEELGRLRADVKNAQKRPRGSPEHQRPTASHVDALERFLGEVQGIELELCKVAVPDESATNKRLEVVELLDDDINENLKIKPFTDHEEHFEFLQVGFLEKVAATSGSIHLVRTAHDDIDYEGDTYFTLALSGPARVWIFMEHPPRTRNMKLELAGFKRGWQFVAPDVGMSGFGPRQAWTRYFDAKTTHSFPGMSGNAYWVLVATGASVESDVARQIEVGTAACNWQSLPGSPPEPAMAQAKQSIPKIRMFKILSTSSARPIHLMEIEIYGTDGTNYALASNGGHAEQSSSHAADRPARLVINGSHEEPSQSTAHKDWRMGGGSWLTVLLAQPCEVAELVIYNRKYNQKTYTHAERAEGHQVQLFDDGGKLRFHTVMCRRDHPDFFGRLPGDSYDDESTHERKQVFSFAESDAAHGQRWLEARPPPSRFRIPPSYTPPQTEGLGDSSYSLPSRVQ